MRTYPFEYSEQLQLIVVVAFIDQHEVRMALDTGASHTVVDLNDLMIAGYDKKDVISTEVFETASGQVVAETFAVSRFSVLGESRKDFPVNSYDFLVNGVLCDINGILGLDFFQSRTFCINMDKQEISF